MVGAFRQPEFTGKNRCLPCTVLNVVLVVGAAALLLPVTPEGALVVLFGGFTATYLRGYVVPGTPTLTKRYLPERVLGWFGKRQTREFRPGQGLSGTDVERTLVDADALEPCYDGLDLCLVDEFRRGWDRALRLLPAAEAVDLTPLVGPEHEPDAAVVPRNPAITLTVDERRIGWWPSDAAFRADAAAATQLEATFATWPSLDFADRASILAGLRLWLEYCPDCGGPVDLGEETVTSCCSSKQVVALTCTNCGARILEAPQA